MAVGSSLVGCSPMPATTVDGIEAFRKHALRVELASSVDAEQLARCFEASAGLLPGSTLTPFPQSGEFVYRLRAGPYVFESIAMTHLAVNGSRVLVEVTPDYDIRMRKDFVSNRLDPLYRCAEISTPPRWPASHVVPSAVAAGVVETA
jgi:hypothetical protein